MNEQEIFSYGTLAILALKFVSCSTYLTPELLHSMKSILISSQTSRMLLFSCYTLRSGCSASSSLQVKCLLSYISIASHLFLGKQEIIVAVCRMTILTWAGEDNFLIVLKIVQINPKAVGKAWTRI